MEANVRRVLFVDDEPNILRSMRRLFRKENFEILLAESGQQGLDLLAQQEIHVVVSDQRMPGMMGVEFLTQVKALYPGTIRIMLSGYSDLESVTDAINRGAIYKFLSKPWQDELLRENILKAFQQYELVGENDRLTRELSQINATLESRVEEKVKALQINSRLLEVSRDLLNHLPVAVLGVDASGMIVTCNQAARAMLAADGLEGESLASFLPEAPLERLATSQQPESICLADGREATLYVSRLGGGSMAEGYAVTIDGRAG